MKRAKTCIAVALGVFIYLAFAVGEPALEKAQIEQAVAAFPESGELAVKIDDSGKEGIVPKGHISVKVTHIVDGDTIDVTYGKEEYKVRLLCVDTPESVKSGVEVQPYGKEASEFTEKLVDGKQVKLVFDKGLRDRYGRLLAFVMLENDECLNALLVYEGYARVELVSPNKTYKEWFYKLQEAAVSEKAGMWALPEKKQPFVKDEKGEYIPRYWDEKAS